MAPWIFSFNFPYDTQLIFWSLMFAMGEDGNLKLLTQGPVPKCLALVYGQAPYLSVSSSTSGSVCLGLNSYAGPYHRAAKTIQGISIGVYILQLSVGASSSSSSAVSPDQDSTDDYLEIGGSTCWNSADEGCLIIMVAPLEVPSHNSSRRYPTIRRSEAFDARTPNDGMIQN
jgi:hypothetical protein